jgi:hypothetical protein
LRPIPWPQNSRTIEKPVLLGVRLDRGADVAEAAAGLACAIPRHMHSYVTSTSRRAWMLGWPT